MYTKLIPLIALSAMASCSNSSTSDSEALTTQLDSLFEARYAGDQPAPGGAVLIAQGDSILYERYFGYADMPSLKPIDKNTLFNIASISKQFTVAALLQQDVDINVPASDFFDYPQPFWQKVTLGHLASHTSGIPDSRDRSDRQKCIYANDASSMSYFPNVDTLKFEPGTAYDYLNPSFLLLANVVEQKSGMEFTEYMRERIFAPLGMDSTVYFDPKSMPTTTAHGYEPNENGNWDEFDYGEETFFATRPDGGIYSTARDMLHWEEGLANGKVLNDSLLAMAYSKYIKVSDSPWCDYQRRPNTWYGLGWFIDETPGVPVKVYHTGDNGGFQAYVAKYPELDLKIIVLENRHDKDRWSMAKQIDSIILPRILPTKNGQ